MSSYINNASENIISFVKKINNIDLCKSSTRSLLRKLITSLLETIQFPSKHFWITTSNNNEKNQFPMIKLYIFMHVIKFEMNSNYKNVLENCPKMMFQISCYGCLSRVELSNRGKNRCQPVSRLNRHRDLFKLELGYRKLADADSSRPSPTFHQRSKFPLSRGWTTMKRFDRPARLFRAYTRPTARAFWAR